MRRRICALASAEHSMRLIWWLFGMPTFGSFLPGPIKRHMSTTNKSSNPLFTTIQLAERWNYHRASIPRLMARFGFPGVKFGSTKQAGRRYSMADVLLVEKLAGVGHMRPHRKNQTEQERTHQGQ